MDTLISLAQEDQIIRNITLIQFTFSLLLSLVLNLILAKFYKYFNTSYSSPTSVIETIVLVGIIITLIMVIIGSNIARAFALVGAMSIVRFRNPLKSPKDLVFIFASIVIGMSCGTFFYVFVLFVVLLCLCAVVVPLFVGFLLSFFVMAAGFSDGGVQETYYWGVGEVMGCPLGSSHFVSFGTVF